MAYIQCARKLLTMAVYCITTDNHGSDSTIFKEFPEFENDGFRPLSISPCVDKGKPDPNFNDIFLNCDRYFIAQI